MYDTISVEIMSYSHNQLIMDLIFEAQNKKSISYSELLSSVSIFSSLPGDGAVGFKSQTLNPTAPLSFISFLNWCTLGKPKNVHPFCLNNFNYFFLMLVSFL